MTAQRILIKTKLDLYCRADDGQKGTLPCGSVVWAERGTCRGQDAYFIVDLEDVSHRIKIAPDGFEILAPDEARAYA